MNIKKRTIATIAALVVLIGPIWATQLVAPPQAAQQSAQKGQQSAQQSGQQAPDLRGTNTQPIVVRVQPAERSQPEIDQEKMDRKHREAAEQQGLTIQKWLVAIGIVQAIVFVLQLIVFGYQAVKLRQTVDAAGEQAKDMKASIAAAQRAAAAMEGIATNVRMSADVAAKSVQVVEDRTARQLRAYLSIVVGSAIYQDRVRGLRFEAKPLVINNGATPAKNVRYVAKAAILPVPLPHDFAFSLPPLDTAQTIAPLGPQQHFVMNAFVDDLVDDNAVAEIKMGATRALYVWGRVEYKDIFGKLQETKFCLRTAWFGDNVWGYWTSGFNDAT